MEKQITVQTIKMTHEQKSILRRMAKRFGLTIGRGREKDWGSIPQLVEGIANGRFLVVENPSWEEGDDLPTAA